MRSFPPPGFLNQAVATDLLTPCFIKFRLRPGLLGLEIFLGPPPHPRSRLFYFVASGFVNYQGKGS